jgi:phage terminase large subunit-like protein
MFSANRPDALRGPQFEAAWCDELCKWRYPDETFDMLQFGLRLGARPRQVVTTTPRPIKLLERLLGDPATLVDRAPSRANAAFLADDFIARMEAQYGASRLGRQELLAEVLAEREDALWRRAAIDAARVSEAPPLARILVAVDPPASSGQDADACGLVVAGLDGAGTGYVLADASMERARPLAWAERAVGLYHEFEADRILAEVNQGGEMVQTLIHQVDATVPVRMVRATRGKFVRAEPVAALYEQARVRHIGSLPLLEDEMCDFGPAGLSSGRSPDRLDALVWALTDLMLAGGAEPRVRRL